MAGTAASGNYVWRCLDLFAEYGEADAIVTESGCQSFLELRSRVLRMAATLREHGFRSGTGVAVLLANPPHAVTLHLALHLLGCRSVWIATAPRSHQRQFLESAQVERLIYDPATHDEIAGELTADTTLPVYCLGPGGAGPDLVAHQPTIAPPDRGEITEEPQSLFQTSGTTGSPKLVHHRQRLFEALPDLATRWVAEGRPVLRHLNVAGHWHVATQMTAVMVLCMGGTLVLRSGFSPAAFLACVAAERINSTVMSPPMLYALLDEPSLEASDLSSLQVVTVGGSAVAPARLAEAIDRIGPVVRVVYAMSESPGITELPGVAHDPAHPERLRSAGLPYGDVQLEIRDEGNSVLPPGATGQVWIRSVLVMEGYWGQAELTGRTIVGGWMATGDVGYLDEDGYLFLVGRASELIITGPGSTNVYPRPIEDRLLSHPEVRAAAVIGVPDDAYGEALHAFVVRAPAATVTEAELQAHVAAGLNPIWTPRDIEFVAELPLRGLGKVDRAGLRERYLAARVAEPTPSGP